MPSSAPDKLVDDDLVKFPSSILPLPGPSFIHLYPPLSFIPIPKPQTSSNSHAWYGAKDQRPKDSPFEHNNERGNHDNRNADNESFTS